MRILAVAAASFFSVSCASLYAESCGGDRYESDRQKLEAAATGGDAAAQAALGRLLYLSGGAAKDHREANFWLTKSASAGDRDGQYWLGRYYEDSGQALDVTEAVAWYEAAAKQECAPALYRLGVHTIKGLGGIKEDGERGFGMLVKAAELGDVTAQAAVGTLLISGQHTKRNPEEGFIWIRRASDNGDTGSAIVLANLYLEGLGTKADGEKARQILEAASKRRDSNAPKAAYLLGWMYMEGKGLPRDDSKALEWMRVAAKARIEDSEMRVQALIKRTPKS